MNGKFLLAVLISKTEARRARQYMGQPPSYFLTHAAQNTEFAAQFLKAFCQKESTEHRAQNSTQSTEHTALPLSRIEHVAQSTERTSQHTERRAQCAHKELCTPLVERALLLVRGGGLKERRVGVVKKKHEPGCLIVNQKRPQNECHKTTSSFEPKGRNCTVA